MTYYIIIAFCVVILLAYFFDVTSRQTKIPGVLLLVLTGMAINSIDSYFNFEVSQIDVILPVMGTVGLILIVLEASLDLTLSKQKKSLILKSMSSAIVLFLVFTGLFALMLSYGLGYDVRTSLVNIIPVAVISSAVAIPSAVGLSGNNREFVIYESSISDIFGILAFNYVVISNGHLFSGILNFLLEIIVTLFASVLFSAFLAVILHKINHHVKYIIIMTAIILVYALSRLLHLPSLLVVLIFGLVMNNNNLFENSITAQFINFQDFNTELNAFKNITSEMTFIVRSFFFVLFGYYTSLFDLLNLNNLLFSVLIVAAIYALRALYLKSIIRISMTPLLYFAPRGLITILLFLSIPQAMALPYMNTGVVTQIIFITILIMAYGNIVFGKTGEAIPTGTPQDKKNLSG
ncbi:MAG TPA: cation:proton antiporter [Smithella sp.]|nr:cation:proton antiporter [Smithella sp.]